MGLGESRVDAPMHIRRCHICGAISSSPEGQVDQCENCGKVLAPFFYFDDRITIVVSEGQLRPPLLSGEYNPIQGLTVYWDSV